MTHIRRHQCLKIVLYSFNLMMSVEHIIWFITSQVTHTIVSSSSCYRRRTVRFDNKFLHECSLPLKRRKPSDAESENLLRSHGYLKLYPAFIFHSIINSPNSQKWRKCKFGWKNDPTNSAKISFTRLILHNICGGVFHSLPCKKQQQSMLITFSTDHLLQCHT